MLKNKVFVPLFAYIMFSHISVGATLPWTILLLPISVALLFYVRKVDMERAALDVDTDKKIKELVDAENTTRRYITKLTEQVKTITRKSTQHADAITKIHTRLSRNDQGKQRVVRIGTTETPEGDGPESDESSRTPRTRPEPTPKNPRNATSVDGPRTTLRDVTH